MKLTQKEVRTTHKNVIKVGYCDLQTLLAFETPIGHTERREGWAADVYSFDDTAIATGYAPFGNICTGRTITEKYEQAAAKISCDITLSPEEVLQKRRELIENFIKELT